MTMNKLVLIVLTLCLVSCYGGPTEQQTEAPVAAPEPQPIYKFGEMVYVGKDAFIVYGFDKYDKTYKLKKIDCRTEDCIFWILETEIRKEESGSKTTTELGKF